MSWLFGKAKKPKVETPAERSEALTGLIERMAKKEDFIEKQIQEQRLKAKAFAASGNKRKALECLRRAKVLESNQAKCAKMRENLEIQKDQIQDAVISAEVFDTYRKNNEVIKNQFGGLNADDIDEIIDDMDETRAQMNDITDALTRPIGPMVDEDELNDELEMILMDEETNAQPAKPQKVQAAPVAEDAESDDDAEAQLQGLMASFGA